MKVLVRSHDVISINLVIFGERPSGFRGITVLSESCLRISNFGSALKILSQPRLGHVEKWPTVRTFSAFLERPVSGQRGP